MEDFELIEKLKNRDNEAFRGLVDRYQKMVLNCTYKFLRDVQTAEDITQDVFIEIYESIGSFRGDAKLSTWIYRIAVTKSINYLKSRNRKKRFASLISIFGKDDMEEKIESESRQDEELEMKDRAKVLAWALSTLPENQRIAFTLSKNSDMSYKEISEVLNTTISSVESLIHRAKTNLKKKLFSYYKENF